MTLTDIIQQYDANQICWYPSAGLDIDTTIKRYEESADKSCFIFSNINYNIDADNNIIKFVVTNMNNENDSIVIQPDFNPEYIFNSELRFEILNKYFISDNLDYFLKDFSSEELIDEYCNQNSITDDGIRIEDLRTVDNMFGLGLEKMPNILIQLIIKKYQKLALAVNIYSSGKRFFFIKSTNQLIYDFLKNNSIYDFQLLG